jgi:hypothetical protein
VTNWSSWYSSMYWGMFYANWLLVCNPVHRTTYYALKWRTHSCQALAMAQLDKYNGYITRHNDNSCISPSHTDCIAHFISVCYCRQIF